MRITTLAGLALACGLVAGTSQAQFTLSKIFFNPSPGADNGQEALEIRGPALTSLAGYRFLAIEGDATNAGVVDVNIDLSAYTTGANGLLLIRDAAGVILPSTDIANASVVVFDFAPDIENGSNTYILGTGTAPAATTDLDADNDGTFDAGALAGFTVADAVGVLENDTGGNVGYADDLGFQNFGPYDGTSGPAAHTPDFLVRFYNPNSSACGWAGGDITGTNPGGPYTVFNWPTNAFGFAEQGITANPTLDLGTVLVGNDADGDGVADGCDGCDNDANKTAPGQCGCGIPEGCSLGINTNDISVATGGSQTLSLYAPGALAGNLYFLLGSTSGTVPGIPVDSVVLPLNFDSYLLFTISNPNSAVLAPSLSFLSGTGTGTATFTIPPGTTLPAPFTAHHAYVVVSLLSGTVVFASNAAPVNVVP